MILIIKKSSKLISEVLSPLINFILWPGMWGLVLMWVLGLARVPG